MSKHTPTPWRVGDDGTTVYDANGYEIVDAAQGPHLHETHDGNKGHWATTPGAYIERSGDEERGIARLIAAAPELLAALRELERVYESGDLETEFRPALNAAKAAIAKAEGAAP